ncbi:MAG: cell division protein FtsA [Deferribacterota bacterium]|nr:cell division protein FtsA [Deferribacterota bacterium]
MVHSDIFVGLDIGSTKICVIVGRKNETGKIDIIGKGETPSSGLRKGVVVNIDSTVDSIKRAVKAAERMAAVEINSVCVGIAGGHIKSFNSKGLVAVKNKEVSKKDVDRAIESATAIDIPIGCEVLHVIPQQFILDSQGGIKNPIGMNGVRLEVDVHIVIGAVSSAQNIVRSCERAGISVDDIVLEQLASSDAVLLNDEKDIGVCLIDGGGGTTDIAVFRNGAVYHTAVLQIGGNNFTRDLAIGINVPEHIAEKIKKEHGAVYDDIDEDNYEIEIPPIGGRSPRTISKQVLVQILQARAEEIFQMFLGELQKKQLLELIGSGVVLTGGVANMRGIADLAEIIFDLPVRVGRSVENVGGIVDIVDDPAYATGVGLVINAARRGHQKNKISKGSDEKVFTKVVERMKSWFGEFF